MDRYCKWDDNNQELFQSNTNYTSLQFDDIDSTKKNLLVTFRLLKQDFIQIWWSINQLHVSILPPDISISVMIKNKTKNGIQYRIVLYRTKNIVKRSSNTI